MQTNYVMIDFENVQPNNLARLSEHDFRIFLFVGANQSRLSFELASSMQALGDKASYIKISGNGPNALDFHIAFYLGEFAKDDPNAYFHIISKDTGFDPLIAHLKERRIKVQRSKDIGEIPILRVSASKTDSEKIEAIVQNLNGRGQAKPRKLKTLANTINSLFTEKLSEQELSKLIDQMVVAGKILVKDGNISYRLDA